MSSLLGGRSHSERGCPHFKEDVLARSEDVLTRSEDVLAFCDKMTAWSDKMAARSFTGESGEVNFEAICRIYPDFIIILSVEMETVRLCGGEGNTFYVVRELLRKVGLPVRIIQITVKLCHHKKK